MRLGALDVTCPVCNRPPGERCVYTTITSRLGQAMVSGHGDRSEAAVLASDVANELIGYDSRAQVAERVLQGGRQS